MSQTYNYTTVATTYLETGGIRFAYRKMGPAGTVPILCLQHFTGTLENWDPIVIDGLAREREVIVLDNTGVGNSGGATPDNVQDMSSDAIKFLTAAGITHCDVLGFSLGGFLAQAMADMRPDLFRKLIIVGAAPQGTKALHTFPKLVEKAFSMGPKDQYLFVFATQTEKSRSRVAAALSRLYLRTEDRDKDITTDAINAQILALTRWGTDPVTIDLTKISQPVLIIQGSNDEMMDSASSLELYKTIPNSILTYYPDSAHGSFLQYPELFVEQANAFLDYFD